MFACRSNYRFNKIRENGYEWTTDFLSGNIDGKPLIVSWRGNASLDWNEISDTITDSDIEHITKLTQNHLTGGYYTEVLAYNFSQFNFLSQQCSQIKNISKFMWFYFLLDDPLEIYIFAVLMFV